jgi:hypothetical protein
MLNDEKISSIASRIKDYDRHRENGLMHTVDLRMHTSIRF